jgi:5-formyltetrahydrofolate cyclo-ligase
MEAKTTAEVREESARACAAIIAQPAWTRAAAVACYASMPVHEFDTTPLFLAAFGEGKAVFVPRVTGPSARDMTMLRAVDAADMATWPLSKWSIPEPPLDGPVGPRGAWDDVGCPPIDLVIIPGMAFDRAGGRLGHGKGYYDAWLERLLQLSADRGQPRPVLLGTGVSVQAAAEPLPTLPHDEAMDGVAWPEGVEWFARKG